MNCAVGAYIYFNHDKVLRITLKLNGSVNPDYLVWSKTKRQASLSATPSLLWGLLLRQMVTYLRIAGILSHPRSFTSTHKKQQGNKNRPLRRHTMLDSTLCGRCPTRTCKICFLPNLAKPLMITSPQPQVYLPCYLC